MAHEKPALPQPSTPTRRVREICGLAERLTERIQLTSDGLAVYPQAIDRAFRGDIDYAQLIKIYGNDPEGQKRYSPAECIGCEKHPVIGYPDAEHISTS